MLLLQVEEVTINNFYLSSTSPPSQQTPPGCYDPADAEPAVVPDQEVPRRAGLPQRRQAPLPEPVGEATRKHLLLRRCLLLWQDGPPPQSLGESAGEEKEEDFICVVCIKSWRSDGRDGSDTLETNLQVRQTVKTQTVCFKAFTVKHI